MNATLTPTHVTELAEAVRATPRLLAVGAQTKPRLSAVDCAKLSTVKLSGIVEYEPSEFTFTALAGTPVRDIAAALAERGQYLPFDPMLADAGATLGGTVAAGLSGPGRFRFGGVRDFILGVQFVDGAGRVLRLGGKVVKNAAGFDVPKFFVGSLGRFGVLTEITFKVFPAPASRLTLLLIAGEAESVVKILTTAGSARWEIEALDWLPETKSVALRLGGPAKALATLAEEILRRWPGKKLTETEADELWTGLREFRWASDQPVKSSRVLIKVVLAPGNLVAFYQGVAALPGARVQVSAGGNVAFVSVDDGSQMTALDQQLSAQKLGGLTLRGPGPLWLGVRPDYQITAAVKAALDAENRFPGLDD
jgi:glycolate oxidase FAD binding subunit